MPFPQLSQLMARDMRVGPPVQSRCYHGMLEVKEAVRRCEEVEGRRSKVKSGETFDFQLSTFDLRLSTFDLTRSTLVSCPPPGKGCPGPGGSGPRSCVPARGGSGPGASRASRPPCRAPAW